MAHRMWSREGCVRTPLCCIVHVRVCNGSGRRHVALELGHGGEAVYRQFSPQVGREKARRGCDMRGRKERELCEVPYSKTLYGYPGREEMELAGWGEGSGWLGRMLSALTADQLWSFLET